MLSPAAPGPRVAGPPVELAADLLFSIAVGGLKVEPWRRTLIPWEYQIEIIMELAAGTAVLNLKFNNHYNMFDLL